MLFYIFKHFVTQNVSYKKEKPCQTQVLNEHCLSGTHVKVILEQAWVLVWISFRKHEAPNWMSIGRTQKQQKENLKTKTKKN